MNPSRRHFVLKLPMYALLAVSSAPFFVAIILFFFSFFNAYSYQVGWNTKNSTARGFFGAGAELGRGGIQLFASDCGRTLADGTRSDGLGFYPGTSYKYLLAAEDKKQPPTYPTLFQSKEWLTKFRSIGISVRVADVAIHTPSGATTKFRGLEITFPIIYTIVIFSIPLFLWRILLRPLSNRFPVVFPEQNAKRITTQ